MTAPMNPGRSGLNKWRLFGWGAAGALLLAPLIAMQFTTEVQWTGSDFVVMGAMFALAGGAIELAVRASSSLAFRIGAAIAVLASFLLAWVNLAAGLIGDEDNPANLMFFGIVAIAITGSFIARSDPAGMARAMVAAAAAQALVAAIAWLAGLGAHEPPGAAGILMGNLFFVGVWLLAALLFRKAADR